jgi:hypothetical protein
MSETRTYELPEGLLKNLLDAIEESNTVQATLVTKFEHNEERVSRLQSEVDKIKLLIYEDSGGRASLQTTLERLDYRLKRMEKIYTCILRSLLAIVVSISITSMIWVGTTFFNLVVREKMITNANPAKIDTSVAPHTK